MREVHAPTFPAYLRLARDLVIRALLRNTVSTPLSVQKRHWTKESYYY